MYFCSNLNPSPVRLFPLLLKAPAPSPTTGLFENSQPSGVPFVLVMTFRTAGPRPSSKCWLQAQLTSIRGHRSNSQTGQDQHALDMVPILGQVQVGVSPSRSSQADRIGRAGQMGACLSTCCCCYCELQGRFLLLFIGCERELPPSSASCRDSVPAKLLLLTLSLLRPPERTQNGGAPNSRETDFENPRAREVQGLICALPLPFGVLAFCGERSDNLLNSGVQTGP